MKPTVVIATCASMLALTGCQTITRILTADKPVPVAVQVPQVTKPAFAMDALPLGSNVYDQVNACLAEREQRKAYELQLEAGWKKLLEPVK